MGIGVSIFLIAVGAILAFAVEVTTEGIDLNTVGVILMVVGAIGLLVSFMFWDRLGWGGRSHTVIEDRAPRERRVVTEREVV